MIHSCIPTEEQTSWETALSLVGYRRIPNNILFGVTASPPSHGRNMTSRQYVPSPLTELLLTPTKGSPQRPNYGAYAEAPSLGLAFYLNGQLDVGSSAVSSALGNATEHLDGMITMDTVNQKARNASTSTLGKPRVGGGLQFIENLGADGVLVAMGGMQRSGDGKSNELVSVFAVRSKNRSHLTVADQFRPRKPMRGPHWKQSYLVPSGHKRRHSQTADRLLFGDGIRAGQLEPQHVSRLVSATTERD